MGEGLQNCGQPSGVLGRVGVGGDLRGALVKLKLSVVLVVVSRGRWHGEVARWSCVNNGGTTSLDFMDLVPDSPPPPSTSRD